MLDIFSSLIAVVYCIALDHYFLFLLLYRVKVHCYGVWSIAAAAAPTVTIATKPLNGHFCGALNFSSLGDDSIGHQESRIRTYIPHSAAPLKIN